MKTKTLLFIVLISLFYALCTATTYTDMDWELNAQSIDTFTISMQLSVHNPTSQIWIQTFATSPFVRYSIDGMMDSQTVLPLITEFSLAPGETWVFEMAHNGFLIPEQHTFQAHLSLSTQSIVPVGNSYDLQIGGSYANTIGLGNELVRVPIDFYWRNSLYECIFEQSDLNGMHGTIYGLSWYNNFHSSPPPPTQTLIYLGSAPSASLANSWISADQLTPVYNGFVDYPQGQNRIFIPFNVPFILPEGNSLIMMVNRAWQLSYYSSTNPFYCQECPTNNARRHSSDAYNLDPYSPPSPTPGQLVGYTPKTTFYFNPEVLDTEPEIVPMIPSTLFSCAPNPFRSSLELSFHQKGSYALEVFNLRGQSVFRQDHLSSYSQNTYQWLPTSSLKGGIYLIKISGEGQSQTRKVILLR